MEDNNTNIELPKKEPQQVDPKLYKQASRRVAFKTHVFLYVLINLLLWIIWAFIFRKPEIPDADPTFFKLTLFVSIVWLIILMVHYVLVYRGTKSLIEKELKKLKQEIQEKNPVE